MLIAAITIKFIGLCCEIKKSGINLSGRAGKKKGKRQEEMVEAGDKTLESMRRRRCEAKDRAKIVYCNFHCCCFAMPELLCYICK